MVKNQKGYIREMRSMIRRVQTLPKGESLNPFELSHEEAEILSDCIKNGYVIGTVTSFDKDTGREYELRTMDGKIHPELFNNVITPKGLAFLKPSKTDIKASIALIISILALLISFLSQLDRIIQNIAKLFHVGP